MTEHVYLQNLSKFQRFIVTAYQSNLLRLYLIRFSYKLKIFTNILDFMIAEATLKSYVLIMRTIILFNFGTHSAFMLIQLFALCNQIYEISKWNTPVLDYIKV